MPIENQEQIVEKATQDVEKLENPNPWQEVDWSVFTKEEENIIKELLKKEQWQYMASAIRVQRPEQEYQLQKLIFMLQKPHMVYDSAVRKELRVKESKEGKFPIETPEQEKEWQEKIDAEDIEHKKKVKRKQKEMAEGKLKELKKKS